MVFSFFVFDQGKDQLSPLCLKVIVRDADDVVAVYDDVGNMKPPVSIGNLL